VPYAVVRDELDENDSNRSDVSTYVARTNMTNDKAEYAIIWQEH